MSTSPYDPLTTPRATTRARPRPGWTEIAFGVVAMLALEFGLYVPVAASEPGPVTMALFMTALSAVVAGGGFAVAALVRVRSWAAFGVRRTTWRWLLAGLAGGVVAVLLKIPANMAYVALTGDASSPQAGWSASSGGGVAALVASFLFLAVLTPLGEELLFRGVVTTALLRYGAVAGVVGSAVIFAVLHGASQLIPFALIVGLMAAELRRRSGSVWPGVALHCTFNLVSAVGLFLVLPAVGA